VLWLVLRFVSIVDSDWFVERMAAPRKSAAPSAVCSGCTISYKKATSSGGGRIAFPRDSHPPNKLYVDDVQFEALPCWRNAALKRARISFPTRLLHIR